MSLIKQVIDAIEEQVKGIKDDEVYVIEVNCIRFQYFDQSLKQRIERFNCLQMLTINDCDIRSLENFPHLPSLIRLDLVFNQIPGGLTNLRGSRHLQTIMLGANNIDNFQELNAFTGMQQLFQLDLLNNPIQDESNFRKKVFDKFPSLMVLDTLDRKDQDSQSAQLAIAATRIPSALFDNAPPKQSKPKAAAAPAHALPPQQPLVRTLSKDEFEKNSHKDQDGMKKSLKDEHDQKKSIKDVKKKNQKQDRKRDSSSSDSDSDMKQIKKQQDQIKQQSSDGGTKNSKKVVDKSKFKQKQSDSDSSSSSSRSSSSSSISSSSSSDDDRQKSKKTQMEIEPKQQSIPDKKQEKKEEVQKDSVPRKTPIDRSLISPVNKGGKGSIGVKRMSNSAKAGIVFPVGRIGRMLRKADSNNLIGQGARVYCAAVLEYLTAQLIEVSGLAAKANQKSRINPSHIKTAIRNDGDFKIFFGNSTIKTSE